VRALAETIEPGGAVAGVLVEHAWAGMLADTVQRMGGAPHRDEFVDADADQVWDRLLHDSAAGPAPGE
jgi:hypothetical protein